MKKSLIIQGKRTPISMETDERMQEYAGGGEKVLGLAFILEDKIAINKSVPRAAVKKIVAHEIFHLALYRVGASQSIPPEIEEVICQTFSQIYFELKSQGF